MRGGTRKIRDMKTISQAAAGTSAVTTGDVIQMEEMGTSGYLCILYVFFYTFLVFLIIFFYFTFYLSSFMYHTFYHVFVLHFMFLFII